MIPLRPIYCPRCEDGKTPTGKLSLGTISTEGYVIIRNRLHHALTIMADTYSIICDCGYFIRISDGKIMADATSLTSFTL